MLTCILLFMVGLKLEMGTAYFVVLAIAAILCCVKFGMNIAGKSSDLKLPKGCFFDTHFQEARP